MLPSQHPESYRDIPAAIAAGDVKYILDALRALPVGADQRELIRNGFESSAAWGGVVASFAWHCVRAMKSEVLAEFLAANEFGITLKDCCTYRSRIGGRMVYLANSLSMEAMKRLEPGSLRLALKLDPDNEDVRRQGHMYGGHQCTYHYWALAAAVDKGDPNGLECAQLLRDHGVPIYCDAAPDDAAMHALFFKTWPQKMSDTLAEVMTTYRDLGLLDIEKPVASRWANSHGRGQRPIIMAVANNMRDTAKALIFLGCKSDDIIGGKYRDLQHLAMSVIQFQPEIMSSCITAAMMNRHLAAAEAGANRIDANSNGVVPRSRRRAGL